MIPISKPRMGSAEERAALYVLRSGQLAQGARVRAFEREFAHTCNASECVAVGNGTQAIELMLRATGMPPGSHVIVPTFTFFGTAEAVVNAGYVPVFCDVDAETFNLDSNRLMIDSDTRAILVVHLYGRRADMAALRDAAPDLLLLEDACQAHGIELSGDAAAFSFYATKNITTGGEGGAVVTNSAELARQVALLRSHSQAERYLHIGLGGNYRMTEVQAAIGSVQLERLAKFNADRFANAMFYDAHLRGNTIIKPRPVRQHVWHQYTIRVPAWERDDFCEHLAQYGIGYGIYYPIPLHKQPAFAGLSRVRLPVAEQLAREVVSLPVHPGVTLEDVEYIVEAVNEFEWR